MASCSTYLANKILDHIFGKETFEADDDLELRFYSTIPNSDGSGGTEISDPGYAPIPVDNSNGAGTWSAAGSAVARQKLNDIAIAIPAATGDWAMIVAWKLLDSSGNVYTFGLLQTPLKITNGDAGRTIPIGAFIQNLT
jgi:hypothetical protein